MTSVVFTSSPRVPSRDLIVMCKPSQRPSKAPMPHPEQRSTGAFDLNPHDSLSEPSALDTSRPGSATRQPGRFSAAVKGDVFSLRVHSDCFFREAVRVC